MLDESIAYIILAGLLALLIAQFQYIYKSKLNGKLKYSLFISRTITLFCIGLLLVNPKFESITFFNEKPNLVIAADNSESIDYLNQGSNAKTILNGLRSNQELLDRFDLQTFSFGKNLSTIDSLSFKEQQTNLANALDGIGETFKEEVAPILLLSDGNQTLGEDYSYKANSIKQAVYPIVIGDSTLYEDISIKQLNVNRFVFLKNRFPVEVILNYSGTNSISTEFRILSGNQTLFKKTIQFSPTNTSEIVSTSLLADKVGIKTYKAELVPINKERNTVNNTKNFGVEVIDQKTNIAIVSERIHPDLGAIKKAIESNEQRNVSIVSPIEFKSQEEDYQLVILYQPTRAFESVFKRIKDLRNNVFYITGNTTDWTYLNNIQNEFKQSITNQTESYQPILNRNYSNFIVDNISFSDYPPLDSEFGEFGINAPHDVLMFKAVNGLSTELIMMATYESNNIKAAILNGEGLWRWRAQTYLENNNFESFDTFINKLVQFLSSKKRRNRLQVDYKSFYDGNEDLIIFAQYFNKSFEFDPNAALTLELTPEDNSQAKRQFPLLISNNNYKIDLSGLASGKYNFTIKHNSEPIEASGGFEVLDYNVEQQFLNANISKLQRLANDSGGKVFFKDNIDDLINTLLTDSRYRIVQKSTKNIVPLIDWKYLLGIIALSLFFEWFTRKYHGLI